MKKLFLIMALVLVAQSFSAATFANTIGPFTCKGYYGSFSLAFTGPYYTLKGTISPFGTNKVVAEDCHGKYASKGRGFFYYTSNKGCSADYFRTGQDFLTKNGGPVALVNTSGADTEDYSGYAYRVFSCTPK